MVNPRLDGIRSRLDSFSGPLRRARERWRRCEVYGAALLIFAASRLVVAIGVNFGTRLVPQPGQSDVGQVWYHGLLQWDLGWYAAIIRDGYRYSDDASVQSSVVFYPIYPLISYAVKSLLGVDESAALLIVSNAAALAAALLMTKFVKDELGDEIAILSLAFFCFFPTSIFLSSGYSESLCLVFVLLSLMLLTRERFVLAAALAGLAVGTRSAGIVMIPVILWEMWWRRPSTMSPLRLLPKMVLCAVLAASGLLAYMAYLGIEFGHPLAFATGQSAWHPGTLRERFVAAVTLDPFRHSSFRYGGWFLTFLALTICSFRRLRFAVLLYGLGALMLPYFTLGITESMNRYVLMCLPAFMGAGIICKGRPWLASALIGVLAALLFQATATFSQGKWVG
jgi:Mannosyltransferase (PIG-V)